jgi:hypothetical protein
VTRDKAEKKTENGSCKWLSILDEFNVQFLVLDTRDDQNLFEVIRSQPNWTVDFESGNKALLARATGA